MKITRLIAAITVSASLMLGPAALAREETPVDMKDLPSPAQTTIKEKAGNDQILRIAKETRKGKECYDAVVNRDGKEMAILVDTSGKFIGTHPEKSEEEGKERSILIGRGRPAAVAGQVSGLVLATSGTRIDGGGVRICDDREICG